MLFFNKTSYMLALFVLCKIMLIMYVPGKASLQNLSWHSPVCWDSEFSSKLYNPEIFIPFYSELHIFLTFSIFLQFSDLQPFKDSSVVNEVLESFGESNLEDQGQSSGRTATIFVKLNSRENKGVFCFLSCLFLCCGFSLLVTGRPVSQLLRTSLLVSLF